MNHAAPLMPGVKPWVKGVANLRGRLLPVMDLGGFLGLELSKARKQRRVLVVEYNDLFVGLLVDEVVGMQHFAQDALLANTSPWRAVYSGSLRGRPAVAGLQPLRPGPGPRLHGCRRMTTATTPKPQAGSRSRSQIIVLFIALIVFIMLLFANFAYLNTQSTYDKQYIGHAGELRVLSQRIAKNATEAAAGKAAAFKLLGDARNDFAQRWGYLKKGDPQTGLPAAPSAVRARCVLCRPIGKRC